MSIDTHTRTRTTATIMDMELGDMTLISLINTATNGQETNISSTLVCKLRAIDNVPLTVCRRELAKFSQATVISALQGAGMSDADIKALNALEVGCGKPLRVHL